MVQDGPPMLDLEVKVININPAQQHKVLEKCRVLKEYGQFVDILRDYQAKGDSDAFKHTIEQCIDSGILADYLKKKGSEVINMLIAEYDYDMDIEVQREEAYTEGLSRGREEGREEGRSDKLIEQLKKKLSKGKSPEEIAGELEESVDTIQELMASLGEDV